MNAHPLPEGTWLRSKVMVSDSGDFNDREAEAGTLGYVSEVSKEGGKILYQVVFWPSYILNSWDPGEIDKDAEVLPAGHRDIPSPNKVDLASAVADVVATGDVDDATGKVNASTAVRERIVAGAPHADEGTKEILAVVRTGTTDDGLTLTFEEFDRLAGIVGIGDRLTNRPDPFAVP